MKRRKIAMEAYIQKFHTLGGSTLSEHKRNFNLYLNTLKEDPSFDPSEFFNNLHPLNPQEEIFHVRLLQKFNQHSELINILKSGNRILARIALKDETFLKELLRKYSTDNKLTDELTPFVSYVTRVNLIYKLAHLVNDENVAEEFYKKVYERYGLKFARVFLVKCGSDFVKDILHEFNVELGERDLILLHKHSPELFEEYLKAHPNSNFDLKLSTYLAKANFEQFHKLTKYATFTLGKRLRRQYINAHKDDLIKDPDSFPLKLDKKKISKHLKADDMIKLFENSFRNKRGYRYYSEIDYLQNYPRKLRGYILFTSYRNVYKRELWENHSNVEEDMLQILLLEDRMKFDFINNIPELLPLSEAISILKTKINVTSDIWERGNLCVKLLQACSYNENYDQELLEILKYFYGRHKNDNGNTQVEFLSYLLRNFKLENLGREYWEIIEEIILLLELNDEHLHCKEDLLGKFLIYQFSNGIECTKTLVKFFKALRSYSTDFSGYVGKYEKICILRYPELFSEIYTTEEDLQLERVNYLNIILRYNKRCPQNDHINPYNYYEFWSDAIKKYIENKYYYTDIIISLLECKPENEDDQQKADEFWEKIKDIGVESGFTSDFYAWLLKKHPLVILQNPNKFFESSHSCNASDVFYQVNKFYFLGLTEKLDACGLKILSSESANKTTAISYFSCQSKSVDLLINLSQKYSPDKTCKINVKAEDIKKLLDIQTTLIRSFKNTPVPSKLIEALLPFCNGDYFKYSLEPLYFLMYHTTEDKIEKPIYELLKRAVSVRKHTVHLMGALGSVDLKVKVFSMMAEQEKNVSVKKYIFGKLYNHFVNEKTLTSWELLRDNINLITIHDKESLYKLKKVNDVPKKFLNSYLIAIWDFFSNFQNKSEFDLISYFNNNVIDPNLDEFCRKVITNSLFNPNNEYISDIEVFAANYLLMKIENMDERINFVWDLIQTRAKNDREKHRIINTFCSVIKTKNPTIAHKNLISKLCTKVCDLNITQNLLKLELLINSTVFYVNWDKELTTLINFIVEQHNLLIEKCSPQVLHFFKDFLENFLNDCFDYNQHTSNVLNIIKQLLLTYDSKKFGLLGFLMLPSDTENCTDLMKEVVAILKRNQSTVLRVYLEDYLNEHPEFDNV